MPEQVAETTKFINLGVVINKEGMVLVIRRAKEEAGAGGAVLRWAFPGGKQRLTESRNDCVKRETLVETGYAVKPERQISLRLHPQFPMYIAYHLCRLEREEPVGKPLEPDEIAEIRWVKPVEIPKLITSDLDPGVRAALGLPEKNEKEDAAREEAKLQRDRRK